MIGWGSFSPRYVVDRSISALHRPAPCEAPGGLSVRVLLHHRERHLRELLVDAEAPGDPLLRVMLEHLEAHRVHLLDDAESRLVGGVFREVDLRRPDSRMSGFSPVFARRGSKRYSGQ